MGSAVLQRTSVVAWTLVEDVVVDPPLWREEHGRRVFFVTVLLLNPHAVARQVRVRLARVLVRLAKQALAVNRVQPTTEQPLEIQTEAVELFLLAVDHPQD